MNHSTSRKRWRWVLILIFILGLCGGGYRMYDRGRPAPIPFERKLFDGVTYYRRVRLLPRAMVVHILKIDTKTEGIRFLVTPPDENWKEQEHPVKARKTSQFLDDFDLQIAVNGDGFFPWWSHGPLDYYPHEGDAVTPNGLTASSGQIYATGAQTDEIGEVPELFISRRGSLVFNDPPNNIFHAISGDRMLVVSGQPADGLDASELDPRTAIGLNRNGRWVYIVVIDGRQPFYSEGATFAELAEILIDFGAYNAMALDGGGSSTLVIEGDDGKPVVLNSPIDQYVPGRERPVANHLGIYVR
ncbi:MAG: phosphodiester glycosidase family protein [Chloroflexi bacterium]|nr:phosphodiester glycosidase family protein [Chloroflexota bacterium]